MFLRWYIACFLIACSNSKQITNKPSIAVSSPKLPLWIEYVNIPDSIKDFSKVYFTTKGIVVMNMKEAIELIMTNSNDQVLNKLKNGSISSEKEIKDAVQESLSKPICSNLRIKAFNSNDSGNATIDSIWCNVSVFPLKDTSVKARVFKYYPTQTPDKNIYIQFRNLLDTVLASGLLK
jgi:hypothetical protein